MKIFPRDHAGKPEVTEPTLEEGLGRLLQMFAAGQTTLVSPGTNFVQVSTRKASGYYPTLTIQYYDSDQKAAVFNRFYRLARIMRLLASWQDGEMPGRPTLPPSDQRTGYRVQLPDVPESTTRAYVALKAAEWLVGGRLDLNCGFEDPEFAETLAVAVELKLVQL